MGLIYFQLSHHNDKEEDGGAHNAKQHLAHLGIYGVPMRMFFDNFGLENYNWTLPNESTKGELEEELRRCELVEKPVMPKKLDGKVSLIPTIPVFIPAPSQPQVPRQPPPPE